MQSINLTKFVRNPFTEYARFDYKALRRIARYTQRIADDILDLEEEKIFDILLKLKKDPESYETKRTEIELWEKILSTLKHGRRTGTSCIGLADTLAMLNLKYDSEQSIKVAGSIYKTLALGAYESSIQLAEERGAFPIWNHKMEKDNPFLDRIRKALGIEVLKRRNINLLTIPPSGSLSIILGVSSGIEPVFNLSYNRRRKVNKEYHKIDFVDQNGDCWEEYTVYHNIFNYWKKITSKENVEDSPYYKSTTNEIDPLKKIEMVGNIQKWVDNAISQTTNLPEDISKDRVSDMYLAAWKYGLKGFTVYREGSRSGVLINKSESKSKIIRTTAPKRPKELIGEAFSTTVKGEKFTVVVGLMDDCPYEIFAYKGNSILGKGLVVKNKKGHYSFVRGEESFDITNNLTDEQEAITRGYSYGLRHGGDERFAVEQLNKTKGDLTSFSKAIARILKKYIPDNTVTQEKCPKCKSLLVYQEGCKSCQNCGYSKCG